MIKYLARRSLELVKITKGLAEKRLADVPEEKRFWCSDGTVLKNLWELEIALRQMSEATFCRHSSETRSDFSNWVRDIIGDEKLARDLQKSTIRAQAARRVSNRLAWLKNKWRLIGSQSRGQVKLIDLLAYSSYHGREQVWDIPSEFCFHCRSQPTPTGGGLAYLPRSLP